MTKSEITQEVIDACVGTCHSLDQILGMYFEEEGWTEEDLDLEMLDEAIFECEDCNWWCDTGEYTDNEKVDGNICSDCGKYNYDEDGEPV